MTRRRWRRRKKLLDDLKERKGYCQLKEESLDRTMWRNRFGRVFGPVVWQITDDDDSECVSTTFSNYQTKRMCCIILSCDRCLNVPYFSTLPHKDTIFTIEIFKHKHLSSFCLQLRSEKFILLKRIRRKVLLYIRVSLCNLPVILVTVYQIIKFLYISCKVLKCHSFLKFNPLSAELFDVDGRVVGEPSRT